MKRADKTEREKPRNMDAYRADLSMAVALRVLNGDELPPAGVTPHDWALYLQCSAIQDLAKAIERITP